MFEVWPELFVTFRDLGVGNGQNAQLALDNDRVFDDLWRKDNMPMVLNNPYSESDKVKYILNGFTFGFEGLRVSQ